MDLSSSSCPPKGSEKERKLLFIARLANFLFQNLFSQTLFQTRPDIRLLYMTNSELSICEHEWRKWHTDGRFESACSSPRRHAARCPWHCWALAFYLRFFALDYLRKMRDDQEREDQKHELQPDQDFWSCHTF